MNLEKIDFVLTWVDGGDAVWQEQKNHYLALERGEERRDVNGDCRYRENGLLRYWFRSVEKFAPWVNKVFFITCGQKPNWLDEANPKLRLVNHSDYIPSGYLPTFHSNTIELNLHRIDELSEHFVLFNDDVLLLRAVGPDFFFRDGLPLLSCDLRLPYGMRYYDNITRIKLNNSCILQTSMDVYGLLWKNWRKNFNVRALGFRRACKNMVALWVNKYFMAGEFGHLSHPHLKSTLAEIWEKQPKVMDMTSRHKFRSDDCVNHWLACAWNMTKGHFNPVHEKCRGREFALSERTLDEACNAIRNATCPQICLNDTEANNHPEQCSLAVKKAFQELLPDKSSYELYDEQV